MYRVATLFSLLCIFVEQRDFCLNWQIRILENFQSKEMLGMKIATFKYNKFMNVLMEDSIAK